MQYKKVTPKHYKDAWKITKIFCDICKKEIIQRDQTEIQIEAKIGDIFPAADCRKRYIIDVCSECFLNKLKPLIEKTFNLKFEEPDADDYERLDSAKDEE